MTGLAFAGGSVPPGTTHDYAIGQAGPSILCLERLPELGYEKGRNIAIEYRWAEGGQVGFRILLSSCASRSTLSSSEVFEAARAAKEATNAIPIATISADPVGPAWWRAWPGRAAMSLASPT